MAAAIPYVMAASAVMSAFGAIRQGQAAKAAGKYNAQINMQNAQIARSQADAAARQADRETYLRLGAIHAAQGKAGGTSDSGSVLDVLGDVAAQSELERQDIIYRGEMAARGYQNTAQLDRFGGDAAATAGYLKAGSELLGGGANAYTASRRMRRV